MSKHISITSKVDIDRRKPKGNIPGWSIRFWLPAHHGQKAQWSPRRKIYAKGIAAARREAENYRIELEEEINDFRSIENITFGAYARAWHEERGELGKVKKCTWKTDELEIRELENSCLANIDIKELDEDDLEQFIRENKRKKFSHDKQRKLLNRAKQILKHAKKKRITRFNAGEGVDNIKRKIEHKRTALAEEEQKILIDALDELKDGDITGKHIAVKIVFDTGLRRGEVLGLQWGDVDFKEKTIDMQRQFTVAGEYDSPKYDSVRLLPLEPDLEKWLIRWRKLVSKKFYKGKPVPAGSPICVNTTNKEQLKPANFDRWWRNWFVKIGLGTWGDEYTRQDADGRNRKHKTGYKGRKLHELRHTVITETVAQGSDLKSAMTLAGHKSINTTAGYIHKVDKRVVEAAHLLNERRYGKEEEEEPKVSLARARVQLRDAMDKGNEEAIARAKKAVDHAKAQIELEERKAKSKGKPKSQADFRARLDERHARIEAERKERAEIADEIEKQKRTVTTSSGIEVDPKAPKKKHQRPSKQTLEGAES